MKINLKFVLKLFHNYLTTNWIAIVEPYLRHT